VQRHGSGGAFAVEAGQLGLAGGGGKPLPETVRGKMEAAFGANFADVRVHVGPQADRIGAIAFTVGSDIYFAPGRYQPETAHGQQLLGHELAHVVQQRTGRVKNLLGSGLAVVQDTALEAEADRLGQRAAVHRVEVQAKRAATARTAGRSTPNASRAVQSMPAGGMARGATTGAATGAAFGFAVAGFPGVIGGAVGGAVLGPFFEWWYRLPTPFTPTPAALNAARQNLIPAPALVPYAAPVNPADQILNAARQNLTPAPALVPYTPRVNPAALNAARQNLIPAPAQAGAQVGRFLPQGWRLNDPEPRVVALSEQTTGKTLDQMIQLPEEVTTGQVLYKDANGADLPANYVLRAGVHKVQYRYQFASLSGLMGSVRSTILHIKPPIDGLMRAMGFVSMSWRWELTWGTHGTLHKDFHLTVPKKLQCMPDKMDNIQDILDGIFPQGEELDGTHMTIECRMGQGAHVMNNAAYFLNDQPKYPKGYTKKEQEEFVNACKNRLNEWKKLRRQRLIDVLNTL
jgi:hypothetical protein